MVVFEQVSKKYEDTFALNNFSFKVGEGEILGYVGPNGAGKTTTIKILVGLINEFGGKYYFCNKTMPDNIANLHQRLGYLPQDVAFQEWRTVDHALQTFGKLSGLRNPELERRIKEMLALFDLSAVRNKKIVKLSGGMIQKLGIAQALLHKPQLLVLDEPLSGLDPSSRYKVKVILKDLSKNGTTIFFSSHILSDVQDIANKICIINNGCLLKTGTVEDLQSNFSKISEFEIVFSNRFKNWQKLYSVAAVKDITQHSSNTLLVSLEKGYNEAEVSHDILKILIGLNSPIRSFKPVEPNLDELYLKYIESDES